MSGRHARLVHKTMRREIRERLNGEQVCQVHTCWKGWNIVKDGKAKYSFRMERLNIVKMNIL